MRLTAGLGSEFVRRGGSAPRVLLFPQLWVKGGLPLPSKDFSALKEPACTLPRTASWRMRPDYPSPDPRQGEATARGVHCT